MAGKAGLAILTVVATVGPLAAVVWPDVIKWVAVAGYEIILLFMALLGSVVGKLRERWVQRITDGIDRALGRRFTRFRKHYREYILSSLRLIDMKGLATVGYYTPDLDEVFVDVSLGYRPPHEIPAGVVDNLPPDAEERHSLADFLTGRQPVVLAILGAPGSGKTTLLRHTARQTALGRGKIPILLYLRDHVSSLDAPLAEVVERVVKSHVRANPPAGWFDQQLRDGGCVVFLDGLDEVPRQEDRLKVVDWVEAQIARYPKNDFVVTSRPHGYRSTPVPSAWVLQARSFTNDQVRKFVHNWYFAVERATMKGVTAEVRQRAEDQAKDLLDRLENSTNLADLTANPLLLTMVVNVHRYRGALPGSRVDLYAEICQVMLWRRQEAKRLKVDLSGDKKEALLRVLAYRMMENRVRDLPFEDVVAEITGPLLRMSRDVRPADFLADVSSNGLLVERESGVYAFSHLTFQEYLAATHIREKGLVRVLADNVDDPWWRETTLLYSARSDADEIVRACMKSDTVKALSLAFECLDQDSELDPNLVYQLNQLIHQAGTDPGRRRLFAGVLLTRHLRQSVLVGDVRICTSPINEEIYTLFRADIPSLLPDGPQESGIVTGMRPDDAVSFANWAGRVLGDTCRLPTRAQLDALQVSGKLDNIRAAWLRSPNDRLWPGPFPWYEVDAVTQRKQIEDDLVDAAVLLDYLAPRSTLRAATEYELNVVDTLLWLFRTNASMVRTAATWPFQKASRDLSLSHQVGQALVSCFAWRHRSRAFQENVDKFIRDTHAASRNFTFRPDAFAWLSNRLDKAIAEEYGQSAWFTRASAKFVEAITPILTRQEPLSAPMATALRITALCLGAESSGSAGKQLPTAAAALTLLQRRLNGEAEAPETILLAVMN